jgi:hypothetical protein
MFYIQYDGRDYNVPGATHAAFREHIVQAVANGPFWQQVESIDGGEQRYAWLLISPGVPMAIIDAS